MNLYVRCVLPTFIEIMEPHCGRVAPNAAVTAICQCQRHRVRLARRRRRVRINPREVRRGEAVCRMLKRVTDKICLIEAPAFTLLSITKKAAQTCLRRPTTILYGKSCPYAASASTSHCKRNVETNAILDNDQATVWLVD